MTSANAPVGDVYPTLTYDDASAAIDWLCRTFGFQKRLVVPGPEGRIEHSELSLGGAVVMVSSPHESMGRVSPRRLGGIHQGLCVRIDDPDAHYRTATAAGVEVVQELRDEDYGSRGYMAKDLEGHVWYFGNYQPGAHWDSPAAP